MGGISISNIGSGLQIDQIIEATINAESTPATNALNRREANAQATLSGLGSLKAALSKFNDAVVKLTDINTFNKVKATSSDSKYLGSSAGTTATAGTYNIDVNQLARGSRLESGIGVFTSSTDLVGQGQLSFAVGSTNFTVDVVSTDTLADLRNKINTAGASAGVNANIVNTGTDVRLVLTSKTTGDNKTLTVTNNDASLDNVSTALTTAQTAQSAKITVDGIEVTSETNTFTNAVSDLTFVAIKETEVGKPVTVTVGNDKDSVTTQVKALVDSFNELIKTVSDLGKTKAVEGSNGTQFETGLLSGDALVRRVDAQLRSILGGKYDTGGTLTNLQELGIKTKRDGTLELDTGKLSAALDNNYADVGKLFTDEKGISKSLGNALNTYISSTGVISNRQLSLQNQIKGITDERTRLAYRISQLETRLRKQYTALDGLVAGLNNTGTFLSQQLSKLPGFSSGSKS